MDVHFSRASLSERQHLGKQQLPGIMSNHFSLIGIVIGVPISSSPLSKRQHHKDGQSPAVRYVPMCRCVCACVSFSLPLCPLYQCACTCVCDCVCVCIYVLSMRSGVQDQDIVRIATTDEAIYDVYILPASHVVCCQEYCGLCTINACGRAGL